MLNKEEFAKTLIALADMFGKNISEFMLDAYYAALKEYPISQVKRAVFRCIKNYKYNTLPKPADILEYLEGTKDDRALIGWLQAKEAVQKGGYYASVIFKDPIIAHCIQELGGWEEFCRFSMDELPFVEKRFMDLYRLFEKRDVKENIKLIGFIERTNNKKGCLENQQLIRVGFERKEVEQVKKT